MCVTELHRLAKFSKLQALLHGNTVALTQQGKCQSN